MMGVIALKNKYIKRLRMDNDVIVEWEVTMKCNYNCGYCTILDKQIIESPKEKLKDFQLKLHELHPSTEIFVFGGEPFLNKNIKFIINNFNELNQKFVIQTNASIFSSEIISSIMEELHINISVHPDETSLDEIKESLMKISNNKNVIIKNIDIMFVGKKSLDYFIEIKKLNIQSPLTVLPVSDFTQGNYKKYLVEFNKLKKSQISKFINFEKMKKYDPFLNEIRDRSYIWEDMHVNLKSTMNKPCMYKEKYFLYDASLNLHNCCYRSTNNGFCQHNSCFMM